MPPLPTTYDDETKALIASIQRRQKDLTEFQIPRLRNCRGPLNVQQNFAAELREDIDALSKQIEALDVSFGDQKGERNRRALRMSVDEFLETLGIMRRNARAALLTSKRVIDSQSVSQREELLRSSVMTEKQNSNEKSGGDALMKANDDVTDSLRRTIGLMQTELERSVLTSQMLDSSTATLRSTSATHDTLEAVMGTSKQLITALEKSDWLDRLLIISAVCFFFLVVLFILKQRFVDRGLRIALWWTRFLPTGDLDFDKMERGEGAVRTASAVASSVIAASLAGLSHAASATIASAASATSTEADVTAASLSPTLSSIAASATDSLRTSDQTESSSNMHDEL
ncbi:Sec20-domain-containing protein [Athelia psychrophila]|uniref:Sec20-domain-containing protein n=1 Tax=Athelia psychrophila TaxID=1759441 RepID=A0A166E268_9AGAM|nr:Sec20-domain-containing protein [Fibularhizoctonia sp. CBS 109695]